MLFILYLAIISSFSVEPLIAAENGSNNTTGSKQVVRIGVIVDLESEVGKMTQNYISMAISDFYAINANYHTRLALSVKNSPMDAVVAASAALELMKNEQVDAIIGPQWSTEAKFVINLGKTAQVPIISTSATSPSLSTTQNPFFIRTCQDDYSQIRPLTSIVQAFGWRQVILIYEDTEFGNGLIPYLTDSFQQIDTRIVYRSVISLSTSSKHELNIKVSKELDKIKEMETRVLVVHMNAYLGSQVFKLAKQQGMMSKGYVWIITDGLSTILNPIDKEATDSMEGVLGVRPYVPITKSLKELETKMKLSGLNLFGLWAYDTIWALAKAAELVSHDVNNSSSRQTSPNSRNRDRVGLKVSESGPRILKKIQRIRFKGLSGEFRLIRRQLQVEKYEIINKRRKTGERVIGYWTPKERRCGDQFKCSSFTDELKEKIIWPGNDYTKLDDVPPPPKGWVIPVSGKKLKIGVPLGSLSFEKFVNIQWDPLTLKATNISGFAYDIFSAALEKLPFQVPHEFFAYVNASRQNNGTYNDLLYQIKLKKFDMVVADTTITANRSSYVDFTLPYMEAGVSMVVRVKEDEETQNIWIFLKPLSWDLWLTIGVAFIYTGFVVWFLEHYSNVDFWGPPHQQLGTMLWFSFSTLIFAQNEKLKNKWSRFVLVIWLFVMLIFTQSYTASLASMLTVHKLRPEIIDINELRSNNYYIGYGKTSFVKQLLTRQLNFSESRLRPYTSPEEFHDAMSKGSKNGGIDAVIDEIPYVKLLLSKYCSKYKVVGPTYKTAGFGFAFPLGSTLVSEFSKAILNITQDPNKLKEMDRKYFEQDGTKCEESDSKFSSDNPSLSVHSFSGLFIITGMVSVSSCFIHLLKFYSNCSASSMNVILPESSLPSLHASGEFSPIYGNHLHQVEIEDRRC
ncbi:hypothetical protein FNV43_RR03276 [Rhamnella rubrinervis]|uniref:Glutamate receptor n=1 Tax=Rhamnella rubrinervis TaxID=2594499 RepID=A0A8K0MP53_9ROSA|nr:hypothetical protein FNV43_RR03276 [Rhamnella rubrinervis]